jgi:hypothetical protein
MAAITTGNQSMADDLDGNRDNSTTSELPMVMA